MMAHDETFAGEHLRLTTFVRIVEKIPQRPSRFQRRAQKPNGQTDSVVEVCIPAHAGPDSCNRSQVSGVAELAEISQVPEAETTEHGRHVQLKSQSCTTMAHTDSGHGHTHQSCELPILGEEQAASPSVVESEPCKVPQPSYAPPVATAQRKPPVSQTQKSQRSRQKPHRSHNTNKKRNADTELTMVRTRTQEGLPTPGHTETGLVNLITEVDPIEESQSKHPVNLTSLQLSIPKVNSSRDRNISPHRCFRIPQDSGYQPTMNPAQKMVKPQIPNGNSRKSAVKSVLDRVSDGFSGMETMIPIKPSKTRTTHKRKKEVPIQRSLALTNGSLPIPAIQGTDVSIVLRSTDQGNIPSIQRAAQDIAPTFALPDMLDRKQIPTSETPQGIHRQASVYTEHLIFNQLSGVTAPPRPCSESSESEEDEEQDQLNDQSSNDEDTDGSTDESQDEQSNRSSIEVQEPSYFDNAMYDTDGASRGDDDFWTQYGATI